MSNDTVSDTNVTPVVAKPAKTVKARSGGSDKTPGGIMPKSQLVRHKLTENTVVQHVMDKHEQGMWHNKTKLKKMIESWATYRLYSHKVLAPHLAKPLVMAARYFSDANKPEFRNRDKAPATVAEVAAPVAA